MKKFLQEFKDFISRGNVMDMAVGIIIGGAFTSIVNSLVKDIINPFLGLFGGMNFDQLCLQLPGEVTLNYGSFITAVLNFLIMAMVIFLIIKAMNTISARLSRKEEKEEVEEVTEKECPFCRTMIPIGALRCPNCTSVLTEEAGTDKAEEPCGEAETEMTAEDLVGEPTEEVAAGKE